MQRWLKRVEKAWLVRLRVQQVAIQPWNSPAAGSSPRRGSAAGDPPGGSEGCCRGRVTWLLTPLHSFISNHEPGGPRSQRVVTRVS